jgi:hypothetical protein
MRIVKEDQNLMVIKDRNILIFLTGAVFLFIGLLLMLKPNLFASQPPFWYGLAAVLVGGFVVSAVKVTTVTLDKISSKMLVTDKSLLSQSKKEFGFDQIVKIELQRSQNFSRKGGGSSYKLAFILNNGEQIPLSILSGAVMGIEVIPGKGNGVRIASFLNVPFEERRPLTVNETISAIQTGIQNAAQKEAEKQNQE